MQSWLSSSLVRNYPTSRAQKRRTLVLHAARGETVSFQVCFRTEAEPQKVQASAESSAGLSAQVRRVGYVPFRHFSTDTPLDELDGIGHLPGLVPDPLLPGSEIISGPHATSAFWITVRVPADAKPGRRKVIVTLTAEKLEPVSLAATVVVHKAVAAPRRDFPVTHWFYADALCDWYHTELWQESFWPLLEAYLRNLSSHYHDTTHIPAFTPPTDGVKRPTQLLGVGKQGDRYTFDWTLVKRWIKTAQAAGLTRYEWNHLFTQWGAKYAIRIYEGHGETKKLLWDPETLGVSPIYRDFLSQYLPEFKRFLDAEGLFEASFFHLSDEPHGDEHRANYRLARQMLREIAPWMTVMDALSQIEFAREGLTDVPIAIISETPQFVSEGFPAWTYFCCEPRRRYLNRLMDTPLVKTRMAGWLFHKTRARGFLHWGHNYWCKFGASEPLDPYQSGDGKDPELPYGDTFVVYPGEAGPVDSIRWEVWAESLQDYALLQAAGIDPSDAMLSEIEDYAKFPRSESWIQERRQTILAMLDRLG
jgi:hypothetical protein